MKHKTLFVVAAAMVLAVALCACGRNKEVPAESVSPTPSAETTILPTTSPDSVREEDTNTGDMTDPDNSVNAGDGDRSEMDNTPATTDEVPGRAPQDSAHDAGSAQGNNAGSTTEAGSAAENNTGSAMDDMKRAGEDLGDAVQDTGRAVEDAVDRPAQ